MQARTETMHQSNFTVTRFTSGDEVVRQFSYGPGGMMGQCYDEGTCPYGFEQGYGRGGMMGGFADGTCPGTETAKVTDQAA